MGGRLGLIWVWGWAAAGWSSWDGGGQESRTTGRPRRQGRPSGRAGQGRTGRSGQITQVRPQVRSDARRQTARGPAALVEMGGGQRRRGVEREEPVQVLLGRAWPAWACWVPPLGCGACPAVPLAAHLLGGRGLAPLPGPRLRGGSVPSPPSRCPNHAGRAVQRDDATAAGSEGPRAAGGCSCCYYREREIVQSPIAPMRLIVIEVILSPPGILRLRRCSITAIP